jgi:hypothetical protein
MAGDVVGGGELFATLDRLLFDQLLMNFGRPRSGQPG